MMFTKPMSERELQGIGSTALAHVGDAVFELYVRSRLCAGGVARAARLHDEAVSRVRASAQAVRARELLPLLNAEERAVFMRARNADMRKDVKSATPQEYHLSTAFEALIGWLYLSGACERLEELLEKTEITRVVP